MVNSSPFELIHTGQIDQNKLVELCNKLEEFLLKTFESESFRTRVITTFIEIVQNIIKYSADKSIGSSHIAFGYIKLKQELDCFSIISSNKISPENRDRIRTKVNPLIGLSIKDLKGYYKKERRKPVDQNTRSAGLGFIDIAIKTDNHFQITFDENDNEILFKIEAKIRYYE